MEYFQWLNKEIADRNVRSESDLSRAVEIGFNNGKSLMRLLGYSREDVTEQSLIKVGTTSLRVDFRVGKQENSWLLDLKFPCGKFNCESAVNQMKSYLLITGLPFGVLFDGRNACVVIYSNHRDLRNWRDYADKAICETQVEQDGDCRELTKFFKLLHADFLQKESGAVEIARKMARKQRDIDTAKKRHDEIIETIQAAFQTSTQALAVQLAVLPELKNIHAQPQEVLAALRTLHLVKRQPTNTDPIGITNPTPPPQNKINPQIRRLIVEICESHDFEFLQAQHIPKLRIRTDGHVGNGYMAVTGSGVPEGLTVGGVDRPTGLEIIRQLERIQGMPPQTITNPPRGATKSGRRTGARS